MATHQTDPRGIYWGSNEWHPEWQWLLKAYDIDKQADRDFAMTGIQKWQEVKP